MYLELNKENFNIVLIAKNLKIKVYQDFIPFFCALLVCYEISASQGNNFCTYLIISVGPYILYSRILYTGCH